jgi:hypothetical protein
MEIEKIYRHGDVILYKLVSNETPKKGIISKETILEHGEVTGHAHRLAGEIEILEEKTAQKEMTFKVLDRAVLTHEEHDRIVLEKGIYLKVTQVEYNPFENAIRWIRD